MEYDKRLRAAAASLLEGNFKDAESVLAQLVRDIQVEHGPDSPMLLNPLVYYARAVRKQRPWNVFPVREREALEHALRLGIQRYGAYSIRIKELYVTLADSLRASGSPVEAVKYMEVAVRIAELVPTPPHILAHDVAGLAGMLLDQREFSSALTGYERAFRLIEGQGDELSEFLLRSGQGRCLLELGRYNEALPLLKKSIAWGSEKFGPRNPSILELVDLLSRAEHVN